MLASHSNSHKQPVKLSSPTYKTVSSHKREFMTICGKVGVIKFSAPFNIAHKAVDGPVLAPPLMDRRSSGVGEMFRRRSDNRYAEGCGVDGVRGS
ncbi:hypothetical protein JTE90_002515, partial [Oedothorax gibbosus]